MTARCNTGSGSLFCCMRRAHPATLRVEQNPRQQAWFIAGLTVGSVDAVSGKYGLDIVPKRLVDDGLMFAWIAFALMDDFTAINRPI